MHDWRNFNSVSFESIMVILYDKSMTTVIHPGNLGRGRRGLCLQCRVVGTGSTLIWSGAGRPLGAVRALPPGGRRPMVAALAVHTHSAHVWKSSLNNHTFFFT